MVKRIAPQKKARLFLAEWREKRRMTQEQLADATETTKATISRWETGDRDPPYAALCMLAASLGIHVSALFFDPELPRIDSELAALPEPVSRKLIQKFNDTIEGVKIGGKISTDD